MQNNWTLALRCQPRRRPKKRPVKSKKKLITRYEYRSPGLKHIMQCPKCSFEQPDQHTECPRCGIIIDKYRRLQDNIPQTDASATIQAEPAPGVAEIIKALLFYVKPETNRLIFGGRALFFLAIFIWGLKFIFMPMESNYVFDNIHERLLESL